MWGKAYLVTTIGYPVAGGERQLHESRLLSISHRVSSAKLADKVIMLDDGFVLEAGTHDDLMSKNGAYKELHDKQLKAENEEEVY